MVYRHMLPARLLVCLYLTPSRIGRDRCNVCRLCQLLERTTRGATAGEKYLTENGLLPDLRPEYRVHPSGTELRQPSDAVSFYRAAWNAVAV